MNRPKLIRQPRFKEPVEPIEIRTPTRDPLPKSTPDPVAEKEPVSVISREKPGLSESETSQEEITNAPAQNLTKSSVPPQVPPKPSPEVVKKLLNLKIRAKTPKVAQTDVKATTGLDLTSLSRQPMNLRTLLKGNESKLTSLVVIGGKTYVIKSGAGYTTMKDHLTNTDIIRHLLVSGVRAPVTVELNDTFRAALEKNLGKNDPAAKQLLDALGTHDQISAQVPGLGIDAVFDNDTRAQLKSMLEKIGANTSVDAAVAGLTLELDKTLNTTTKGLIAIEKKKGFDFVADLADPVKRSAAIDGLMNLLKSPKSQKVLSYMGALSKQSPADVAANMRSEITVGENGEAALVAHAKTKQGAFSLGGLGLTDIVNGMNDRIMGDKFNGGNFLFDAPSNDLWCIDNAKDLTLGLSSPNDQAWKTWFLENMTHSDGSTIDKGESISENIHWAVYTRQTNDNKEFSQNVKLSDSEVDDTASGMEDAVTSTMQSFRNLVNDTSQNALPKAVRDRLKARLDFVDARTNFAKLLNFAEFETIPTATNPWLVKKLGRKLAGKVLGRTAEQTQAETWKNQARNPGTSDAALDTLDETVSDYLGNNPNADQRVLKALFAVRSERFVRSLKANTAALKNLPTTNKAWGHLDPTVTVRVKAVADRWAAERTTLDDKTGATAINTAMADYGNQLAAV